MDFITNTLGISVKIIDNIDINNLPYFLTDSYSFKRVYLNDIECIFISPKSEIESISIVKKHIDKVYQIFKLPIVLKVDAITNYRYKSLIKEKIPFIVTNSQIYLPFMAIYLQEKFSNEQNIMDKFIPSTQVIFFEYIYKCLQNKSIIELSSSDLDRFKFSNMTISRAFKQLEDTKLMKSKKYGVNKVIYTDLIPKELYFQAKSYLINPVRKKVYINKEDLSQLEVKTLSGLTQLSKISMLNPSKITTYATDRVPKVQTYPQLDNFNLQVELEVWKYNPNILTTNTSIDTLSLINSLVSNTDERIEIILDDLLTEFWNN